jgi:hypothetical protein
LIRVVISFKQDEKGILILTNAKSSVNCNLMLRV